MCPSDAAPKTKLTISYTLVPKNLCAIILSTIYLSTKNLGRKFELIWATENLSDQKFGRKLFEKNFN